MDETTRRPALLVGSEALWAGGHPAGHPLRPERLRATWEMLHAYGAFPEGVARVVAPRVASRDELARFHTDEYLEVVAALSRGERGVDGARCGFGPGDNPPFEGMWESEGLKVGAALVAADALLAGEADVAFSFSGGLHHGGADFCSGFCVFNDGAIAIRRLLDAGLRVAYLDIDAHHGDGVQAAFYDEPRVLTVSLHESGRFLFPGTGFVEELGEGDARGTSVNLPLFPYTDDATILWLWDEIVPPLLERFAPDIVVAQLGVDTHWRDPLTHLALTTAGIEALVARIRALSPRLLALGGGGYDAGVVPRAWTLAWGALTDQHFPDPLPPGVAADHDPPRLRDPADAPLVPAQRAQARQWAEAVASRLGGLLDG